VKTKVTLIGAPGDADILLEAIEELRKRTTVRKIDVEVCDGEESGQVAAQAAERPAAAFNGPAHDALAGVCFCSGYARPCQGAANVASEMTSFKSRQRMRARPAGGVAKDASARTMTTGLVFPIVYPPACGRARTAECFWHLPG